VEYKRLKPTVEAIRKVSTLTFAPTEVPSASDSDLSGVLIPKKVHVHGFVSPEEESSDDSFSTVAQEASARTNAFNRLGLQVSTERRPSVPSVEEVPNVFNIAQKVPVHGFVEFDSNQQPIKPKRSRKVVNGLAVSLDDLPDEDDAELLSVRRPVHGIEHELDVRQDFTGEQSPAPPVPESASDSKLTVVLDHSTSSQHETDVYVIPAKKVPVHGFLHPAKTLAPLQVGQTTANDLPLVLAKRVSVHGFGDGEATPGSEPNSEVADALSSAPGGLSVSTTDVDVPEEYPDVFADFKSPVHGFQPQPRFSNGVGEDDGLPNGDSKSNEHRVSASSVDDDDDTGDGVGDLSVLASPKIDSRGRKAEAVSPRKVSEDVPSSTPDAKEAKPTKAKLTKGKSKRKVKK